MEYIPVVDVEKLHRSYLHPLSEILKNACRNCGIITALLRSTLLLQVPWANLGRSPVLVSIDRLYILAGPKSEVPTGEEEQYEVAILLLPFIQHSQHIFIAKFCVRMALSRMNSSVTRGGIGTWLCSGRRVGERGQEEAR